MQTIKAERERIKMLISNTLNARADSFEYQLKDKSLGNDFKIDLKARLNETIILKEKIENLIDGNFQR